jgi:hypothetical protein
MSRLWREHGRAAAARRILLDVCRGFPERLDMVDLREAQALLSETM